MTIEQFTKWLKANIITLADDSPDGPDESQFYEAAGVIREARRVALSLGLPEVVEICSLRTPAIALPFAQKILAECLHAVRQPSDTLTPPQVARILMVNPEKVLTWIRAGELRAVNIVKRQGGRPKYRITREDVKAFMNRRTVQPVAKVKRPAPYRGKVYF